MRNFRNILCLLMRSSLRKKDKNQIAAYIVFACLYVFMIALGIGAIIKYGDILVGVEAEIVTAILFSDFVVTIVFGIIAAISFLYLSKDNEFFLSLPIKPSTVFFAKLAMVYLIEVLLCAFFLLPLLITLGIKLGLGALFFALIPVMILTTPLFSLIFIALISMPIMFFITLFKNRGAVSTIIVISLFTIVMGLYYYAVISASANAQSGQISFNPITDSLNAISNIFFPFYMLAKLALGQPVFGLNAALSVLAQLGIFLGSLIAAGLLSYVLTLMFYRKVNAKVLEQGATKTKKGEFGEGTPFKAMLKREFKEVVRTPVLAFQAFMGVILCPLMVVMMIYSVSSGFSEIDASEVPMIEELITVIFWAMATMMLFMLGVGINPGASFCISREGQNFYYLKLLPVKYKTQIAAKSTLYAVTGFLTTTTSLIAVIVMAIILDVFVWWVPPLCAVGMYSWVYALNTLSLYMDLKSPKLDYKNLREITKRLKNSVVMLVWVFASMIYSIVLIVSCVIYIDKSLLILGIGISVYTLTGPIFAYLFHNKLYSNTNKLFKNQ